MVVNLEGWYCYFDENMHNKHENICLLCVNLYF